MKGETFFLKYVLPTSLMLVLIGNVQKDHFLFSRMLISLLNPMFDHLLELSHRDDSNKWSNVGFGEEITQVESIEINFTNPIWSADFNP